MKAKLAKLLCEAEKKKIQVNIAQMSEIVNVFPEVVQKNFDPAEVLSWLYDKKLEFHIHINMRKDEK